MMSELPTIAPAKSITVKALTLVTIILGLSGFGISLWSLMNATKPIVHLPGEITLGPSPEQEAGILIIASFIGILASVSAVFWIAPSIWWLQPRAQRLILLLVPGFGILSFVHDSTGDLRVSPYEVRDLVDILVIIAVVYVISAYFLLRKAISQAETQNALSGMDEIGKRLLQALEALGEGWYSGEDIAGNLNQNTLKSWDMQTLDKLIALGHVERVEDEDQPGQWLYHLI